MENVLMEAAASQGIWVILFISMLLYVMKSNEKMTTEQNEREENYRILLSEMMQKYSIMEEMKEDIALIKEEMKIIQPSQEREET